MELNVFVFTVSWVIKEYHKTKSAYRLNLVQPIYCAHPSRGIATHDKRFNLLGNSKPISAIRTIRYLSSENNSLNSKNTMNKKLTERLY